jgi:sterol 3beta-glucosyltransferase
VSEGWGPTVTSVFDHVFVFEIVPHQWLFPGVAALIHHAGAGALGPALSAGAPQIIVRFITDQFFWAWSRSVDEGHLAKVRNGL